MHIRYRALLCALAVIPSLLLGNTVASADEEQPAHLAVDVTETSPGEGGSLQLDHVTGFDATGGTAVIEPDSERAETVTYGGLNNESNELLDVTRAESPLAHPAGSVVKPLPAPAQAPTDEPSATPTEEPSANPAPEPSASPTAAPEVTAEPEPSTEEPATDSSSVESPEPTADPTTDAGSSVPIDEPEGVSTTTSGPLPCVMIDIETLTAMLDAGTIDPQWPSFNTLYLECLPDVGSVDFGGVVRVQFDDIYRFDARDGCHTAGFTGYNLINHPVPGRPYNATVTMSPAIDAPRFYSGTLNSQGRGLISYCEPPGILGVGPYTATIEVRVDAAVGTAVRDWSSAAACDLDEDCYPYNNADGVCDLLWGDPCLSGPDREQVRLVAFEPPTDVYFDGACRNISFRALNAYGDTVRAPFPFQVSASSTTFPFPRPVASGYIDQWTGLGTFNHCPSGSATEEVTFTAQVDAGEGVGTRIWNATALTDCMTNPYSCFPTHEVPDVPGSGHVEIAPPDSLLGVNTPDEALVDDDTIFTTAVGTPTNPNGEPDNGCVYINPNYRDADLGEGDDGYVYSASERFATFVRTEAHSGFPRGVTKRVANGYASTGLALGYRGRGSGSITVRISFGRWRSRGGATLSGIGSTTQTGAANIALLIKDRTEGTVLVGPQKVVDELASGNTAADWQDGPQTNTFEITLRNGHVYHIYMRLTGVASADIHEAQGGITSDAFLDYSPTWDTDGGAFMNHIFIDPVDESRRLRCS